MGSCGSPSKQNIYAVEQRRMEVSPQCSEIIIQRKPFNTMLLRLVIFTAPFWCWEEVGAKKREELIQRFWLLDMGNVVCSSSQCTATTSYQCAYWIANQVHAEVIQLFFWVKNSHNLWSLPGLFSNRRGGRKRLVVPLLWIIHPILLVWVLA